MTETDQNLVKRLKEEAGLPCYWAIPYVRGRGRCGYCGQDLLADRQGYATAQIDHLLPKACYPACKDEPDNWVLSCSLCNHTKSDWHPFEKQGCEDPVALLKDEAQRSDLITKAQEYIQCRRAEKVDHEWRKTREILGYALRAGGEDP